MKIRADYQCDSQPFSLPGSKLSPVAELHQKGIDKIAYRGGILDNVVGHYRKDNGVTLTAGRKDIAGIAQDPVHGTALHADTAAERIRTILHTRTTRYRKS